MHRFLNNFTAGEWSPLLDGRADLEQYDNSSRLLENWRPMQYGGARFRTGNQYVIPAKYADRKCRLFPFNFSTSTRFVLEFGHQYIRFITNGQPILHDQRACIFVYAEDPIRFLYSSATVGAEVQVDGFDTLPELNGRRFLVNTVSGGFTTLKTKLGGVIINASDYPSCVTGTETGTVSRIYELTTVYDEEDLFGIQFKQINDVMYLVHPNYPPYKLSRLSDTNWVFEKVEFDLAPLLDENLTDITLTCNNASVGTGRTLTASASFFVSTHNGAIFQLSHTKSADSIELNITASATSSTMRVQGDWGIQTSGTWTAVINVERQINGGAWQVIRSFTGKADRNVLASGTETEDSLLRLVVIYTSHTGSPNPRVWLESNSAVISGLFKVTGYTSSTVVTGTVLTELASTAATKIWREGAWSNYRGYPRSIGLYEQRLYFGSTSSSPTRFWGSKSGDFENFKDGSLDDDAVSFVVASAESNPILWMEGLDVLQIGTAGSEVVARAGSQDEPLTPSNVSVRAQSAYGSDIIQALSVGDAVLFLQRQGRRLREMAYTIEKDRYVAPDLTLLSEHVTQSGIIQMGFARQPDPTIMLVRGDGQLAVLTYNREQNVTAFARWVTDGNFESVASIYGSPVDEIWFSVRRTINGESVRYIERQSIEVDVEVEANLSLAQVVFLVDLSSSMGDIINNIKEQINEIAEMYLSKYTNAEFALAQFSYDSRPITILDFTTKEEVIAAIRPLESGYAGDEPGLEAVRDAMKTVTWVEGSSRFANLFTDEESSTLECSEAEAIRALQDNDVKFSYGPDQFADYDNLVAATDGIRFPNDDAIVNGLLPSVFIPYEEFYLDCAVTGVTDDGVITGLHHLEGRSVRVVMNDAVTGDFVVSGGTITVSAGRYGAYVVGLPYAGRMKTMRLDTSLQNGPSQGRKRRICEATFRFNRTQGCKYGKSLDALNEIPFRLVTDSPFFGAPPFTGEKTVAWPMGYDRDASIYVVQDQPLPCTLLGIAIKHDYFGD